MEVDNNLSVQYAHRPEQSRMSGLTIYVLCGSEKSLTVNGKIVYLLCLCLEGHYLGFRSRNLNGFSI